MIYLKSTEGEPPLPPKRTSDHPHSIKPSLAVPIQPVSRTATYEGAHSTTCVELFKGELQQMAAEMLRMEPRESGGCLYGLRRRRGTHVTLLATPPGPNAKHAQAYFAQDPDFYRTTIRASRFGWGADHDGGWHTHPGFSPHPSSTDLDGMRSTREKTGVPDLVEIILSYTSGSLYQPEFGPGLTRRYSHLRTQKDWTRDDWSDLFKSALEAGARLIEAHAWQLNDDSPTGYATVPIHLLPGESPVRLQLRGSKDPAAQAFEFAWPPLPLALIHVPSMDSDSSVVEPPIEVPEALMEQWKRLPEKELSKATVTIDDSGILLTFPLKEGARLLLVHAPNPPYAIEGAVLEASGEQPVNLLSDSISTDKGADLLHLYVIARFHLLEKVKLPGIMEYHKSGIIALTQLDHCND